MDASDLHLERALDEYNEKVNELEPEGASEELMEAYVNRGCVLYMLGYRTSSMDDLLSAYEIMGAMEDDGAHVDSGTYVKALVTIGNILFDQDSDPVEYYEMASGRLKDLDDRSMHFDRKGIVRMCIEVSENLIDSEYPEDVAPWIQKGLSITEGHTDNWSMNRRMQILNLSAEADNARGDLQSSISKYADAIDIGTELLERGNLDDEEELVSSFVSKAECESSLDMTELYIADIEAAIALLEEMSRYHRLSDSEILVTLHHDVASVLVKCGRMEDAEKHLMGAMKVGIRGAEDYINVHGPREDRDV